MSSCRGSARISGRYYTYTPAAVPSSLTMYCALLDDAAATALEGDGWDLVISDGRPGSSTGPQRGERVFTYVGSGALHAIRHFVRHRSFSGAFSPYVELDEEFRLYHNLTADYARNLLLAFDGSGREIEAARVQDASPTRRGSSSTRISSAVSGSYKTSPRNLHRLSATLQSRNR